MRAEIESVLNPAERSLFARFSLSDQNHGWRVLTLLRSQQADDPALLKAGLLHDIGKTRTRITVIDRSLAVAGKVLLPGQTGKWGMIELEKAKRFERPFVVRRQHAAWGADMVAEIGGDALTVELIRRHQDKLSEAAHNRADQLLKILQWADNLS